MDTRLAEDHAQHESKQRLSDDVFEKAVSAVFYYVFPFTGWFETASPKNNINK